MLYAFIYCIIIFYMWIYNYIVIKENTIHKKNSILIYNVLAKKYIYYKNVFNRVYGSKLCMRVIENSYAHNYAHNYAINNNIHWTILNK